MSCFQANLLISYFLVFFFSFSEHEPGNLFCILVLTEEMFGFQRAGLFHLLFHSFKWEGREILLVSIFLFSNKNLNLKLNLSPACRRKGIRPAQVQTLSLKRNSIFCGIPKSSTIYIRKARLEQTLEPVEDRGSLPLISMRPAFSVSHSPPCSKVIQVTVSLETDFFTHETLLQNITTKCKRLKII